MAAIKALMIDVDGVIVIHPHPHGWSVNLERDLGLSRESLQANFFKPHFGEIVQGRAALRDRLEPVLRAIAPHLTCDRLIDYWFQNDAHLNADLLRQLARARQRGFKLHLATAQEHERADFLWRELGLQHQFDAIHYAADLGWSKPHPEFYAQIERRTGLTPTEIFFLDDRIENVEAARSRRWRAALWTGESTLDELLEQATE